MHSLCHGLVKQKPLTPATKRFSMHWRNVSNCEESLLRLQHTSRCAIQALGWHTCLCAVISTVTALKVSVEVQTKSLCD
jgi:hypothetical protein